MDHLPGRRYTLVLGVLVAMLLAGCGARHSTRTLAPSLPAAAAPSPAPVTVPLSLEGDAPRLVAHVEIGGTDLRVMVDTGSSGLRVPATKLPPGTATELGPARPYAYASGVRLQGSVARAPARLGGAQSAAMPLEVVHGTECVPAHPDCAAADGAVPGMVGGRFDGILGISAQSDPDVGNPLWSLGTVGHTYAVHVDPAGSSSLVLGAPADGFVLARLDPLGRARGAASPPAWQARTPICVRAVGVPGGTVCLPTLFDTGTPPLANIHPPDPTPASAPPGSPVTFSTPDGRWTSTVLTGRGQGASVSAPTTPGTDGTITAGLPSFLHTDVRVDLDAGTVGFREHDAAR